MKDVYMSADECVYRRVYTSGQELEEVGRSVCVGMSRSE